MNRSFAEIFTVFLKLGLTSFGGPVAHLGYFREAIVEKKKWLSDSAYADLVALCQFIPGPGSSQVGLGIGLTAGGFRGALAAWLGFTLPSALAMAALGIYVKSATIPPGTLAGLKILAVAVVAHAVLGMAKSLCAEAKTATLAGLALAAMLIFPAAWVQLAAIAGTAALGALILRPNTKDKADSLPAPPLVKKLAWPALALFVGLLAFAIAQPGSLASTCYKAGSLVFGGGHVVLPLLQGEMVPSLVSDDIFLAGYGAAQGVPGPLFTLGSYLGGAAGGWTGALVATFAIFLPSILLVTAVLPIWTRIAANPKARAAVAGANAGVVGILGAALYDPVFTSAIRAPHHIALAVAIYIALTMWKIPPWILVLGVGGIGAFL